MSRYENATEAELALRILEDPKHGEQSLWGGLFHFLLHERKRLWFGNDGFPKINAWMKKCEKECECSPFSMWGNWRERCRIDLKEIQHLYTKILTPADLLADIRAKGRNGTPISFYLCFEDEDTWGCLDEVVKNDDLEEIKYVKECRRKAREEDAPDQI